MSNYFRFYLDGIEVENPVDWDKMKIIIDRDTTLNGLFANYVDKLTFIGDGYDYLINQIDTNRYCGSVDFVVHEYANGSRVTDGFGYEGIIDLSNIELNRAKCAIRAQIEDRTLGYLFKKYKSIKVEINKTGETLNGEALPDILQDFIFSYPSPVVRKADFVSNFFSYLVSYITDNRVTFVSDYYQNQVFTPAHNELIFSNLTGGDQSIINWTDMYGQPRSWTSTANWTATQQIVNFINDNIEDIDSPEWGSLKGFMLMTAATPSLDIYTLHDPEFTLTNVAAGTSTPFNDGGKNVAVASASYLQAGYKPFITLSLDQLYTIFRKKDDLQCALYVENGVTYFRVEPKIYFLNNSVDGLVGDELEGVQSVDETIADELIFKQINYGNKSTIEFIPFFKENTAIFQNCGLNELDAKMEINMGLQSWGQSFSAPDDDLFMFEADFATITQTIYDYTTRSGSFSWGNIAVIGLSGVFPLVVRRRLGYVDPAAELFGLEMEVDNGYLLLRLNKFQHPLFCAQIADVLANPTGYINFYFNPTHAKKGYIKKLEYEVKTGMTKFELYSA